MPVTFFKKEYFIGGNSAARNSSYVFLLGAAEIQVSSVENGNADERARAMVLKCARSADISDPNDVIRLSI